MPNLAQHQSNSFVKLLLMGDSKSGKTGSLASLVFAGYKLRILDYDNGLDVLKQFIAQKDPSLLANVEFRTLRDKRKATPLGSIVDGQPRAFVDGIRMLDNWRYDGVDLGHPSEWGGDCVLVLDSLTFMSDAAYDWREPLVPRSKGSGEYDKRAVYRDAQSAVSEVFATITGESFRTNVIVTSHVRYVENEDGTKKGYPNSVGSALSPMIPRWFNNLFLYRKTATGKRVVDSVGSAMFDLANAKPFSMPKEMPIETALADIFKELKGEPIKDHPQINPPKPELNIHKSTQLRRF